MLRSDKEIFYATMNYWLCYVVALLVFVTIVMLVNKVRKENANVAVARGRKANKIAAKRFNYIINSSIDRLNKEEGIEKIIFFWSQDFFHFDSAQRF